MLPVQKGHVSLTCGYLGEGMQQRYASSVSARNQGKQRAPAMKVATQNAHLASKYASV